MTTRLVLGSLLALSGVFFLPSHVYAAEIDTITGNSNVSTLELNEMYNSGTERMTGFVILPEQVYEIRSLQVEMCRNTAVINNNIRAQLWDWDNGGSPEFTLIGYSDWVDTSTLRDRVGGYCNQPQDLIIFDFGTRSVLFPGNAYILTFNYQDPVTSNASSSVVINRKATTTSPTPDTVIDWAYFVADTDFTPWRVDSFTSYLTYIPSIRTSPYVQTALSNGEAWLDIQEVLTWDGATTTSYTCTHRSDDSEYYGYCFIIGSSTSQFDSIQVVGTYDIPAYDYYYIDGWLKTAPTENGTTRPLADSQTWLLTATSGTYTFAWSIPTSVGTTTQFLLSNSAQTYVDGWRSATAQVYVGFCLTQEECENNYWAFTQGGDGVTVTQTTGLCWNEYQCSFTDVECILKKMFVPCDSYFTNLVSQASTTVAATWPVGYVMREYYAYASSASSTFDIPLNMSAFGLPTTTASINLTEASEGVLSLSDDIDDFVELLETIIWALFWLLLSYRLFNGKNTIHQLSES